MYTEYERFKALCFSRSIILGVWYTYKVHVMIVSCVIEGKKLEGVKLIKSEWGDGLKECKDLYEELERIIRFDQYNRESYLKELKEFQGEETFDEEIAEIQLIAKVASLIKDVINI